MRLSWGRSRRTGLVSIGRTNCLLDFPGDDSSLRRGTFHEACGVSRAVAQGLPGDGHDAEGALRFSQTSFRRQVGRSFRSLDSVVSKQAAPSLRLARRKGRLFSFLLFVRSNILFGL